MASVLIFLVIRLLPGDIVRTIAGDVPISNEQRELLLEELGLNEPLFNQYIDWLSSFLHGHFGGISLESKEPIRYILGKQLPVSLLITSYSLFLSIVISIPLGIYAASSKNLWPDSIIRLVTTIGIAIPNLCIALLLLILLLLFTGWSPPIVYTHPWIDPWNHLKIVFWPTLILSWEFSSTLIRITRSSILNVLDKPYITSARAKGLSNFMILFRHSIPNAIITPITSIGLQFGILMSSLIVMETLFGLPGIGRGLIQAFIARDFPLVQSLGSCIVLISLVINLIVDITYTLINPLIWDSADRIA
jgi:peptide/nickel transport system permease protein